MIPDVQPWQTTPGEVEAVTGYLQEHFPGSQVRALSDPDDPGQLFSVLAHEGTRHTLKLARAVFDDLRQHRTPVGKFLEKHEIARRLRGCRRLTVNLPRGEDMMREERA